MLNKTQFLNMKKKKHLDSATCVSSNVAHGFPVLLTGENTVVITLNILAFPRLNIYEEMPHLSNVCFNHSQGHVGFLFQSTHEFHH